MENAIARAAGHHSLRRVQAQAAFLRILTMAIPAVLSQRRSDVVFKVPHLRRKNDYRDSVTRARVLPGTSDG